MAVALDEVREGQEGLAQGVGVFAQGGVGLDLRRQPVDDGQRGAEVRRGTGHLGAHDGNPLVRGHPLATSTVVTAARGQGGERNHQPPPRPAHGGGR